MAEVTYLDLVEAVRQGKCRQFIDDNEHYRQASLAPKIYLDRNWAVPSYDFGSTLYKLGEEDYRKVYGVGSDLLAKDQFRLPHDEFFFLWTSTSGTHCGAYVSNSPLNMKILGYNASRDRESGVLGRLLRSSCT